MVKIAGGKAGSIDKLKQALDRSKGNFETTWIRSLKANEDLTVRFLSEPDEWYSYKEHYDQTHYYYPCIGEESGCPGCQSDTRASQRWLANVLDVHQGRVVPLKLPLDLTNRLIARYERYGNTITDRDYTLHRMGSGLDTTYDVTAEQPSQLDVSRYDALDLEKVLIDSYQDSFGKTPQEEEDDVQHQREMFDEELDTSDDLDDEFITEEEMLAMSREELKDLAVEFGVKVEAGMNKSDLVKAIIDAAPDVEEVDEDEIPF